MQSPNRRRLAALLLLLLLALCSCKQNPTQEQLYARLLAYFEQQGYQCSLSPAPEELDAPIYKPQVWQCLTLNNQETVLVYFDESNRADYLSEGINPETYGYATHFGLRFVLVYQGEDEGVLKALKEIPTED